MKYVKLFEQFINEKTMKPDPESDVVVDEINLENGKVISSAEIVGAIINSESEDELEEFFFDKYGENAFKQGELAEIKQKWNEWYAEKKEKEAEDEEQPEVKDSDSEDQESDSDTGDELDSLANI